MIPKFRAWLKKEKKMVDVTGVIIDSKIISYLDDVSFKKHNYESFDKIELMQFTGLKDKYGKDIYEGDIVKYRNTEYEVYWNKEYYRFEIREVKDNQNFGNFISRMSFEVIGNIYENKELFEVLEE